MKRLVLLFFCALTLATCAADSRPNILLCIADDASWHHFGANGNKVCRTPNFDRFDASCDGQVMALGPRTEPLEIACSGPGAHTLRLVARP